MEGRKTNLASDFGPEVDRSLIDDLSEVGRERERGRSTDSLDFVALGEMRKSATHLSARRKEETLRLTNSKTEGPTNSRAGKKSIKGARTRQAREAQQPEYSTSLHESGLSFSPYSQRSLSEGYSQFQTTFLNLTSSISSSSLIPPSPAFTISANWLRAAV